MGEGGGPAPQERTVSEASLHSYLVTRHTGRAVRTSIERQIAECGQSVVAVLDFEDVAVIDFSCADEVVAKLVNGAQAEGSGPGETFFFFRGLRDHHLDPIDSALRRRALAVAGERADGGPVLVGAVESRDREAWRAVHRLERAPLPEVAGALDLPVGKARTLLRRLHRRRLLVAEGREFLSLRRALAEAGSRGDRQ